MEKKSNFNKFLTLLERDFCRSLTTIIPLIFMLFIGHLVVAWVSISSIKGIIDNLILNNSIDKISISREMVGFKIFFHNNSNLDFFMISSMVIVALYTLFLWNREWMGSSKSIYTLLSLPIKKSYIVCSKVITMLIFISFNLLVQILTLFIDKGIMKLRINKALYVDENVIGVFSSKYIAGWINLTSRDIVVSLITIITLVLILGLMVLLFRSFKIKGIILGIVLLASYVFIYGGAYFYFHLYWNEYFLFKIVYSLIVSILVFSYSKYILENKVTV